MVSDVACADIVTGQDNNCDVKPRLRRKRKCTAKYKCDVDQLQTDCKDTVKYVKAESLSDAFLNTIDEEITQMSGIGVVVTDDEYGNDVGDACMSEGDTTSLGPHEHCAKARESQMKLSQVENTCEMCKKIFSHRGGLSSHVRWMHGISWVDYNQGVVEIDNLEDRQVYYKKLKAKSKAQIENVTGSTTQPNSAGKVASKKSRLKSSIKIPCPECNMSLPSIGYVKHHVKTKHKELTANDQIWCNLEDMEAKLQVKNFGCEIKCPICEKVRYGSHAIRRHMSVWHKEEISKNPELLRSLIKDAKHSRKSKEAVPCFYCKEIFIGESSLSHHMRSKCLKNPCRVRWHYCPKCGSKFSKKESLEEHLSTHHQAGVKEYTCDLCGKSYAGRSGLVSHKRGFHGVAHKVPINYHQCQLCDKKFYLTENLRSHMMTHSGDFFSCSVYKFV